MLSQALRAALPAAFVCGGLVSPAFGDVLLSDNRASEGLLPADREAIATGATYTWVTSATGNVRGNTDSGIVNSDEADALEGGTFSDMQDNVGENGGGVYAVYGTYQGSTTVATAQFDLKDRYTISRVVLSANFNGSSSGVGAFEVWVSDSPENDSFRQWAVWTDPRPADARDARIELGGAPVEARYVQFFVRRTADGNEGHIKHNQLQLGEMMIYGSTIPEPASAAMAAAALAFLPGRTWRRP